MAIQLPRTYQIDSHRALSGTDSDFTFGVQLPPLPQVDAKGISVVVTGASIPKSYYLIPSGHNTFTLVENAVSITITITPGNYNINNFRTVVLALLNAATLNGSVYSCTVSTITGKYTWSVVGGPSSFTLPDANGSGLHDQFGLEDDTTTALPFTSTNVVKFVANTTLQIRSDIVLGNDNVLQEIYAAQNADFTSIVYTATDLDKRAKPLASSTTNVFRFTVTDEDGNVVDLNGLNVVLTILIFQPIDVTLRDYMKMRSLMVQSDLLDGGDVEVPPMAVPDLSENIDRFAKSQKIIDAPPILGPGGLPPPPPPVAPPVPPPPPAAAPTNDVAASAAIDGKSGVPPADAKASTAPVNDVAASAAIDGNTGVAPQQPLVDTSAEEKAASEALDAKKPRKSRKKTIEQIAADYSKRLDKVAFSRANDKPLPIGPVSSQLKKD